MNRTIFDTSASTHFTFPWISDLQGNPLSTVLHNTDLLKGRRLSKHLSCNRPSWYLHTAKDQSNSKGYRTVGLARSTGQRAGANKDSVVAPGPSLAVCSQLFIFSLFKAGRWRSTGCHTRVNSASISWHCSMEPSGSKRRSTSRSSTGKCVMGYSAALCTHCLLLYNLCTTDVITLGALPSLFPNSKHLLYFFFSFSSL